MPADASQRVAWVSYLRVSTHGQAERELSIPAQRAAIEEYAARHGAQIAREYIETGSGRESHRPQFRRMVGDALASGTTSRRSWCTTPRGSRATRRRRGS